MTDKKPNRGGRGNRKFGLTATQAKDIELASNEVVEMIYRVEKLLADCDDLSAAETNTTNRRIHRARQAMRAIQAWAFTYVAVPAVSNAPRSE